MYGKLQNGCADVCSVSSIEKSLFLIQPSVFVLNTRAVQEFFELLTE